MIRHTIPSTPKLEDIKDKVEDILRTGMVTNHIYVQKFEEEVKKYLGVKHAIAVSSCTSGLMLGIKALGLPKNSRIAIPSFTFNATGHSACWNGMEPYFVDCDRESFVLHNIDNIKEKNIKAILGVDCFGNPCDKKNLQKIADENNIPVFYDSAHGFGSTYEGKNVGNFGEFEVFSLAPTKVLFCGEGGIVATNNDNIAKVVRAGRVYGHYGNYYCEFNGLSSRLPEFNAIIGLYSMKNIDYNLKRRREIAKMYHDELSSIKDISFQKMNSDTVSNNYFGIIIDPKGKCSRNLAFDYIKSKDIEIKKYFDPCLHWMPVFKDYPRDPLLNSEFISNQNITLPIYERLSNNNVKKICNIVKECFK